jgi:hypothetical protein
MSTLPVREKSISDAVLPNKTKDTDRKLKHDDNDRNGNPHHTTQSSCRTEEGICPWCYAWQIRIAHSEPSALGVLPTVALSGVHISTHT